MDSLVQPPRIGKLARHRRRTLLFPLDPLGRKGFGSIPADLVRHHISLMFSDVRVLPDCLAAGPAVGAPTAAMVTEVLVRAGVQRILVIGSCGAFEGRAAPGDLLLARNAWSACGVTAHYFPGEERFDAPGDVAPRVEDALTRAGFPPRPAAVVTTDAPFRETPAFLDTYSQRAVDAVEMEIAAVYAVARFHGISAAAVVIAADTVGSSGWEYRKGFLTYGRKMHKLLPVLWTLDF
jgi:nucleoside phosphorylase